MINGAFKKVFGQEMPWRVLYVGGRNHAVLDSAVGNLTLLGRQTRFGIISFHCSFGVSCSFLLCPYPFVSWFKHHCAHNMIEGSLEVKLPTIWTVESRGEKSQKRKDQKKEEVDARKDRKVAIHCVFPMICGSGGSKSRLAKAAGAEPAGQMRHEKVHAVVARSTFPSQMDKTLEERTTFGS